MPLCVDLRERFGGRYRLIWEAEGATRAQWAAGARAWLLQVSCRYGVIYPVGGALLAAWTDQPRIGARLRALPGVISARGDLEVTVTFHVDQVEAVFALLRPRRRRQVSSNQRARLLARLSRGSAAAPTACP